MMSRLELVFNLQVQVADCISPSTLPILLLLLVTIHTCAWCPKMQSHNRIRWNMWCCVTQTHEIWGTLQS